MPRPIPVSYPTNQSTTKLTRAFLAFLIPLTPPLRKSPFRVVIAARRDLSKKERLALATAYTTAFRILPNNTASHCSRATCPQGNRQSQRSDGSVMHPCEQETPGYVTPLQDSSS